MYWFNEECTFYVPIRFGGNSQSTYTFFYRKKKIEIMVRVCLTLCYKFRVNVKKGIKFEL